ncbi:MAG: glycosyltransferase family 39 protein [Actinomycetaceae bacterium]|nr:glycosyltransferase family 39 protein [Actinomycetaceae bacterium]MDU0970437.1 glycosyltransferase family 39 protein [Actinomycetaceae bacterium]
MSVRELSHRSGSAGHAAPAHARRGGRVSAVAARLGDDGCRRVALGVLLALASALYGIGLSSSGYANSFYAAAAQAGSHSWRAFLWGGLDWPGVITVDKPPASLWLPALFVRAFGLNSWSILLPQAIMGVLTVYLIYRIGRRASGSWVTGILAGALQLTVPVATLMFRFNNPDALLLLLLTASVAATLRALDTDHDRWMLVAGVAVGFAFLTKQVQAFLVLPALAVIYLAFARKSWWRRIVVGLGACLAVVVSGGWWVVLSMIVKDRPYIGGSQSDSFLELTFAYNGFGRLTGDEVGGRGGGMGGGTAGIGRFLSSDLAGQISWLLPAFIVVVIAALWTLYRRPLAWADESRRLARAGVWAAALWAGVTIVVFSMLNGVFHAYYTVAVSAPLVLGLALGAWVLVRAPKPLAIGAAGLSAVGTGAVAAVILARAGAPTWLLPLVAICGLICALALVVWATSKAGRGRRIWRGVAATTAVALLVPTMTWSIATAASPHTGSIVSAGIGQTGGPGGGRPAGGGPGGQGDGQPGGQPGAQANGQAGTQNGAQNGTPAAPQGGTQNGTQPGGQTGTQNGTQPGNQAGAAPTPPSGSGTQAEQAPSQSRSRGGSSLLNGENVTSKQATLLEKNASSFTWTAATIGSQSAASYQLATDTPVIAVGGFNGSDPAPSLAQFKQLVASGKIHYWIVSGGGKGGPGNSQGTASTIQEWVEANYTSVTVDGTTFYDLTSPAN